MRRNQQVEPLPPPPHLDSEAAAEWVRVAVQLAERGDILPADAALLEAYVVSFARWRQAEAEIAATGAVVRAPNGGAQANPWVSIGRAALRDARGLLADLRLTPLKRAAPESSEDETDLRLVEFS